MRRRCLFILTLNALAVTTPALSAEAIQGWIETERRGANLSFTGFAQADASVEIRYEMSVMKEGKGGRSSSRQAGRVRLEADAPRRLSQSVVNIADGDDYCVQLTVYRGSMLVAKQIATPAGTGVDACND